jgi:tetratricopeptide (TPR) repeat protein
MHPMALLVLASAETQAGAYEEAESLFNRILSSASLPSLERYFAMGALGDLRHAQGRYAEAFNIYVQGNEAFRRSASGEYAVGESAMDAMRWMRRYFEELPRSAQDTSSFRQQGGTGPRHHVFLVGFIRSGTTLLEQALASHSDVVTMEEKDVFGDSAKFAASPQELDRLRWLPQEERARYAQAYWSRVRELRLDPGNGVFIDKHPFNALKLPLIAALFPHAKIVFAIRDPRDVILSCLRRRLTMGALTYPLLNLESAARFYADYMLVVQLMASKLPLALHRVRHEDVVSDFEGEVRKVCDFIGIGWSDSMRNFAERRRVRSISSPSAAQIAKGLNSEGIGQWRRYDAQLAPILPILRPWVEHFGYSPD